MVITEENDRLTIGVLFGGTSSEKEVSLATGRYIYSLLDPHKFIGLALYMDQHGQIWQIPPKLILQNTTSDIEIKLGETDQVNLVPLEKLKNLVDLVFIALLGKLGEDGTIQAILELLGIPYTGSGILASAVGMNKFIHKKVIKQAGFNMANDILINQTNWNQPAKRIMLSEEIEKKLGYPLVVKPVAEGSSIGVAKVSKFADLDRALQDAFKWDNKALAEEFIVGREFMCVVWGNDNPQAMTPTEIVFEGDIYTYEGKYMPGKTKTITPAAFAKDTLRQIQETAVSIYELIGICGYGRVDGWIVNQTNELKDDKIVIGEPHTGTIMVPSSYIFQQASKFNLKIKNKKIQTGMSPRVFVSRIIDFAREAHKNKKQML